MRRIRCPYCGLILKGQDVAHIAKCAQRTSRKVETDITILKAKIIK